MIPMFLFFAAGIVSFFCYDGLVKREYKIAKDSWESDDRPPGFFSALPWTSMMRSWTRGKVYCRWTFTTPIWVAQDEVARRLHLQLRVVSVIGLVAWLWLAVLLIAREL